MTDPDVSRRTAWVPPVRPDWVTRFNAEGAGLDLAGVVPLDGASLIATATANTGLDDFGADDWREPFEILIKGLNEEAQLSLLGRIMTRSDLLMFLEGRLRIEDAYRLHPEIEDVVIDKPLWIIGQGRSGTSYLQTLMALDPENRTLNTCDAMFPVPVGERSADGRHPQFDIVEHRMGMWSRVTPEVSTIHDFGAAEPIETIMAESMSFQCPAWLNLLGLTPTYNAYIHARGYAPSLRYMKRILKLLQWQRPGGRWLMKSPDVLRYMPALMETFPDVRLVWAHRDPIKALSSAVNMIGSLIWVRSDQRIGEGMFDAITDPEATAASLSGPIDLIESGVIPRAQLANLQYEDLINDPIDAIVRAYDQFGLTLGAAARRAMADHLTAHPRVSRPKHIYSTGGDERISKERQVFRRYADYFRVPDEG